MDKIFDLIVYGITGFGCLVVVIFISAIIDKIGRKLKKISYERWLKKHNAKIERIENMTNEERYRNNRRRWRIQKFKDILNAVLSIGFIIAISILIGYILVSA